MDDLEEAKQEIERLRREVAHWKGNHADAVKRKKKGQEITSDIIAGLRDDLEKAHERIAELEAEHGTEKLDAALELISLLETCAACTACLHGPEIALEEGAPHCDDTCYPDDDQRSEWLTKIRAARKKLEGV